MKMETVTQHEHDFSNDVREENIVESILLIPMDEHQCYGISGCMEIFVDNFERFGKPFTRITLSETVMGIEQEIEIWTSNFQNRNEISEIIHLIFARYIQ